MSRWSVPTRTPCSLAASMGGDCDDPPRSFGADAVFLTEEEPAATFVLARSLNGDVIAVIDPTDGTVVESYAYGLHGELTIRSRGAADCDAEADAECYGRFGNAFFYTGAPRSPLTGLYDRRARQYSAALRMWISPDPMGFVDGWDRWMYVGGDPVNFVDPLGWGRTEDLGAGDESSEQARLFVASYTMDGARYTRFAHSYVVVFPAAPESFGLGPGEGIRIEAAGGLPFNTLFVDADPVDSVGAHPSAPPQVDIEIVELARISDAQIESMLALSDQLDDPPPDLGYLMYSPFAGLWGPPMTLNCHSVTRMMLDEAGAEWPDEFRGRGLRYSGWRATIP